MKRLLYEQHMHACFMFYHKGMYIASSKKGIESESTGNKQKKKHIHCISKTMNVTYCLYIYNGR